MTLGILISESSKIEEKQARHLRNDEGFKFRLKANNIISELNIFFKPS
jgi:hypothetical protein